MHCNTQSVDKSRLQGHRNDFNVLISGNVEATKKHQYHVKNDGPGSYIDLYECVYVESGCIIDILHTHTHFKLREEA